MDCGGLLVPLTMQMQMRSNADRSTLQRSEYQTLQLINQKGERMFMSKGRAEQQETTRKKRIDRIKRCWLAICDDRSVWGIAHRSFEAVQLDVPAGEASTQPLDLLPLIESGNTHISTSEMMGLTSQIGFVYQPFSTERL
jgi:hypothetical protein